MGGGIAVAGQKTFMAPRTRLYERNKGPGVDDTGTQVLTIGFAGLLITAFFLTQAYSILFTLFFAFSVQVKKVQSNQDQEVTA